MGLLEARSVKKWGKEPTRLEASNTWGNSVHTSKYARESPDSFGMHLNQGPTLWNIFLKQSKKIFLCYSTTNH